MTINDFLKDVWRMMLDHWILSLIVGSIILAPVCPIWIAAFGFLKLLDVSRKKHKYDDDDD